MRPEEERYFWEKDLEETIKNQEFIDAEKISIFMEKIKEEIRK